MAKKGGKHQTDLDAEFLDDIDELDGDIDLSQEAYGADWEDFDEKRDRADARRKIERRREMKRLYSELNDWEEFGLSDEWR